MALKKKVPGCIHRAGNGTEDIADAVLGVFGLFDSAGGPRGFDQASGGTRERTPESFVEGSLDEGAEGRRKVLDPGEVIVEAALQVGLLRRSDRLRGAVRSGLGEFLT